jgi:GTPase SAR1 family protein
VQNIAKEKLEAYNCISKLSVDLPNISHNYLIDIAIQGNAGVGKSSFVNRYAENRFLENPISSNDDPVKYYPSNSQENHLCQTEFE